MILQRMLEKRGTTKSGGDPRTPQYWVQKLFGGGSQTISRIDVNPDVALNYSAVFCGVTIHSDVIKTLPFPVLRREADGSKEDARDHPVHDLLNYRFNPTMSAKRGRKWMESCRWLWGNGYAEIVPDGSGGAAELWPLHPSRVRPFLAEDQSVWYEVTNGKTAQTTLLPQHRMFHVMLFTKDGLIGESVVDLAKESLGLALATDRYGASFFGNDGRPGGVFKMPGQMSPEAYERLQEGMRTFRDDDNRLSTLILEEGAEWQAVGVPNDNAQFIETRKYNVTEWARWLVLPPYKLKDEQKSSFNNIEQLSIDFMTDSQEPNLVEWEDEVAMKLFTDTDRAAGFFAEFNRKARLRGDNASRSAFYKEMSAVGAMSPNDIRKSENMNGIGPQGDKYLVQLNLTTLEKIGEDAEPEPVDNAGNGDADGAGETDEGRFGVRSRQWMVDVFRPLMQGAMMRLKRRDTRWLRSHNAKDIPWSADRSTEILAYFDKGNPVVMSTLGDVLTSMSRCGVAVDPEAVCKRYLISVKDATMESVKAGEVDQLLETWTDDGARKSADVMLVELTGAGSCTK